jgi:hypothetical protein
VSGLFLYLKRIYEMKFVVKTHLREESMHMARFREEFDTITQAIDFIQNLNENVFVVLEGRYA